MYHCGARIIILNQFVKSYNYTCVSNSVSESGHVVFADCYV